MAISPLPEETFARRTGGAFLHEKRTGKVLLGHRGIADGHAAFETAGDHHETVTIFVRGQKFGPYDDLGEASRFTIKLS